MISSKAITQRRQLWLNLELRSMLSLLNVTILLIKNQQKNNDGSFSMTISEQDAASIDMCEKSVLQTAYPTIREAVSSHLSEVSKKSI